MANPFALVSPASRGLSLALTRHLLSTTKLPVYATHRSPSPAAMKDLILKPLQDVDPDRLQLLNIELTSESSISSAAESLANMLPSGSYLQTGFFTGGILHPEKQPADLDVAKLTSTFQVNVISHLLLIKHFSRFLPSASTLKDDDGLQLAKWVHVSARVGSISDNNLGGWYSYRSSKAALNQVVKTFDLHLQMNNTRAICVGVHPGTVKTDLSKDFWKSAANNQLFDPADAAKKLVDVVAYSKLDHRGRIWDWAGRQVPW